MTTTVPAPARRLVRRPGGGRVLGVAAAIADHIGVPANAIRLAFAGLAFAGGLGVALYVVYFIVLPTEGPSDRARPRWVEVVVAAIVGLAAVGVAASTLPQAGLIVPIMLALLGGALIWRQASETDRSRLLSLSRTSLAAGAGDWRGRVRLLAGVALVVAGAVFVLARADVTAVRDGLVAMVVAVVGLALVTGPWWMRTVTQLSTEREARVRSQERADIAAQLHDSVLQTLALIQRNSGSPREVARLARGQERELRTMLYASHGAAGTVGQFGEQLREAAAEIEDAYAITIDVVVVGGDVEFDDGLVAAAAAAREALVNAAKHAGVESVSLYVEVEPDTAAVYVKDRGTGFDLDAVADDRQGVRGWIIGRVERHGGTVDIRTSAGAGTEVKIHMPRQETDA